MAGRVAGTGPATPEWRRSMINGLGILRGSLFFALILFVMWPRPVTAQTGAIAGVVKDSTGAIIPGVTVEAASPALIEKVRTVVTDGEGQYKVVGLAPGNYVVTFTLAGFNSIKR